MNSIHITIQHIGKSADDLRFFIYEAGSHAGGITVHSVSGDCFSYGIAVAREKRNRGVAKAALLLLYQLMKERGFARAHVQIAPENAASLALHAALGFAKTGCDAQAVIMEKNL
ncbi:MAG: GNAT family N-acetyltransferase [Clostridia bacterium]|nr:GNAT family N-acetyltransferase [Clostridia bacterium]